MPIYEPEFAFLPFSCEACGARFIAEDDLALHQRETCWRSPQTPLPASRVPPSELSDGRGVFDGGRRT